MRPRQLLLAPGRHVQGADVDLVAALALQGDVARQHVEVPERETGRQVPLLGQGDGLGELEEAEVGLAFLGAHAYADEFDLRHDEAVAGVAFAHQPVQVGEAGEVERLLGVLFLAEARVPDLVRLDETDDTAAAERVSLVVGVCGLKERTVFFVQLWNHGDVMLVPLTGL